jgi:LysM repeat protein
MSRQRLFHFMTLFLALSLLLVACERPIPGSGDGDDVTPDTPLAVTPVVTPGEEAGGAATPVVEGEPTSVAAAATATSTPTEGEGGDSGTGAEEGEGTEGGETPPVEPTEEAPAEGGEPSVGGDPTAGDDPDVGGGAPTGETTEGAPAESGETAAGETVTTTTEETAATGAATTPTTHTVAAGENLYRIGLRYGVSWVTLAQHNNLANPNRLTVGQVLQIPSATAPQPQPTPSPQTETTYTVRRGDTLYRIGLAYGISWVQIAEANGLVNPNQIFPGQVLKIPVNRPGPSPQFTHTVRPGETLFLISLQYGVSWTAIAQANNISSPYVIYVGQSLVIPGS